MPVLCKELLLLNIECTFTLKRVRDMITKYSFFIIRWKWVKTFALHWAGLESCGKDLFFSKKRYLSFGYLYLYFPPTLFWCKEPCREGGLSVSLFVLLFFLYGLSFTNIHESQECRGMGRTFLYLLTTTSTRFTDT